MPEPTIDESELAELLMQCGHHHHQAYIDADGVDPEWALWYSGHLQTLLWDRAGMLPTRSQIIQTLLNAEQAHKDAGGEGPWPPFYAKIMLEAFGAGS